MFNQGYFEAQKFIDKKPNFFDDVILENNQKLDKVAQFSTESKYIEANGQQTEFYKEEGDLEEDYPILDCFYSKSLPILVMGQVIWIFSSLFFTQPFLLHVYEPLYYFTRLMGLFLTCMILSWGIMIYMAKKNAGFPSCLAYLSGQFFLGFITAFIIDAIEIETGLDISGNIIQVLVIIHILPLIVPFISIRYALREKEKKNKLIMNSLLLISSILFFIFHHEFPAWAVSCCFIYTMGNMILIEITEKGVMDRELEDSYMRGVLIYCFLYTYTFLRFIIECGLELLVFLIKAIGK